MVGLTENACSKLVRVRLMRVFRSAGRGLRDGLDIRDSGGIPFHQGQAFRAMMVNDVHQRDDVPVRQLRRGSVKMMDLSFRSGIRRSISFTKSSGESITTPLNFNIPGA